MSWSFERVAGPFDSPAGGLVWTGERVLFSLPRASRIMSFDPTSARVEVFRSFSCGADGLALGPGGAIYACQGTSRRIARLAPDGSSTVLEHRLAGRLHNFPRDLTVDDRGAIWFSDPRSTLVSPGPQMYPLLDHASVLRLAPGPRGWELARMTFDTEWPSSVLLDSKESILYVSENDPSPSGRRELRAYPIEGDGLGEPEVLHCFGVDRRGAHRGVEGMCLESGGCLLACAGGDAGPGPTVHIFSREGRVLLGVPSPVELAGCAFGDRDLDTLYLTSTTGELWRVSDSGLRGRRSGP